MKIHITNTDPNDKKLWNEVQVLSCYKFMSKEEYRKIVLDFFEKNNRIDILIEAINSEQISIIIKECHSLKGASAMIGLIAFNEILDTIQKSSIKQIPLNKIKIIRTLNDLLRESKNQFLKLT